MNGLQTLPQWKDYFNNPAGALLGLINAAQSIGSVIILPLVGWLSDRFGRKKVLLSGIIIIIIATAIGAGCVDLGMLVFSRVCVGAGGMLIVQPAPLLIAELAYPTHRGKYTSAFWTMYYLGRCSGPRNCRATTNCMSRGYPRILGDFRCSGLCQLLELANSHAPTSLLAYRPTLRVLLASRVASVAGSKRSF